MRKITEIESVFEKYGIEHQGNVALFNQTFFLHTDDVQAEAMTHKHVMHRAQNTELFDTFTHLSGLKEFQKVAHMLTHITKGRDHNLHYHADGDLAGAFYALLQKLGYLNHLFSLYLTVYGTPHKGAETLRIDVPSDIEDPEGFIKKVQEMYQANRRNVACLNISATVEVMRGMDTVYRTVWLLNRLLIAACKGSRSFVPGQVTLFTPYLTQVYQPSVQQQVDEVCSNLFTHWSLYAQGETFCQWMYRLSSGASTQSPLTARLVHEVEYTRRELCKLLEKPFTADDFNDFTATWVLNNTDISPNAHGRGSYWEVKSLYEEGSHELSFPNWVKLQLREDHETGKTSAFTLLWDLHLKLHPDSLNDMGNFTQRLEELTA